MRTIRAIRTLFLAFLVSLVPASSFAGVFLSITIAPPILPVYAQPVCPGDGYLWTPGYWAYGDAGYYLGTGNLGACSPARIPLDSWLLGLCRRPLCAGMPVTGVPTLAFTAGLTTASAMAAWASLAGVGKADTSPITPLCMHVNTTIVHNTYIDKTVIHNTTVSTAPASMAPAASMPDPTARSRRRCANRISADL